MQHTAALPTRTSSLNGLARVNESAAPQGLAYGGPAHPNAVAWLPTGPLTDGPSPNALPPARSAGTSRLIPKDARLGGNDAGERRKEHDDGR
jgi:hypothetical protein